jgi:hypothetical protein
MLETLTTLQRLSPEPLFEQRLNELIDLFLEKIILPNPNGGYFAHGDFLGDWTPVGEQLVSYGHDLQPNLLIDGARVAGRDPELLEAVRETGYVLAMVMMPRTGLLGDGR